MLNNIIMLFIYQIIFDTAAIEDCETVLNKMPNVIQYYFQRNAKKT